MLQTIKRTKAVVQLSKSGVATKIWRQQAALGQQQHTPTESKTAMHWPKLPKIKCNTLLAPISASVSACSSKTMDAMLWQKQNDRRCSVNKIWCWAKMHQDRQGNIFLWGQPFLDAGYVWVFLNAVSESRNKLSAAILFDRCKCSCCCSNSPSSRMKLKFELCAIKCPCRSAQSCPFAWVGQWMQCCDDSKWPPVVSPHALTLSQDSYAPHFCSRASTP